MNQLQAAGYIVENGDAIWGKGATSDEAWQDFLARMKIADVEVVMELQTDAGGFPEPGQTLASDYRIIATTKAPAHRSQNANSARDSTSTPSFGADGIWRCVSSNFIGVLDCPP
jgi:hypothetical protein